MIVNDEFNPTFQLIKNNPDYKEGKCSNWEKIHTDFVSLYYYDEDNPRGLSGDLCNPEEIVIPDSKFQMNITFPLLYGIIVEVDFDKKGVSRKELLSVISHIYKDIYAKEELTSPPVKYYIRDKCSNCTGDNIQNIIKTESCTGECLICYSMYDKGYVLPCGHNFHAECIIKWLNQEGEDYSIKNNCPLCRKQALYCSTCDGDRFADKEYESVVIPIEHRGVILNRNQTFGDYGIYGYDLEDLCIYNMVYDRINKRLDFSVTC